MSCTGHAKWEASIFLAKQSGVSEADIAEAGLALAGPSAPRDTIGSSQDACCTAMVNAPTCFCQLFSVHFPGYARQSQWMSCTSCNKTGWFVIQSFVIIYLHTL